MVGIEAYLSIMKGTYDVGFFVFELGDESVKSRNEKNFFEDLWDRIKVLFSNRWKVDGVPRLHLPFEAQLGVGKSHDFAPISCPKQPESMAIVHAATYLLGSVNIAVLPTLPKKVSKYQALLWFIRYVCILYNTRQQCSCRSSYWKSYTTQTTMFS